MTTLAIETIHGTDYLVAKGPERAELAEVLPAAPDPPLVILARRLMAWHQATGGTE